MKPDLVWSTPRPRLRRALEFTLALGVAGCCHPATEAPPPPIKFELVPTADAKKGLAEVVERLEGKDILGKDSAMGRDLSATLGSQPYRRENKQSAPTNKEDRFADLAGEFVQNLHCKDDGCYAELTAGSGEKAVRINQFVTDFATPLKRWSGWRFVSGMYEGSAIDQKMSADRQRRMAVVVLKGHAWGAQ
jgi:hypothetical protein